MNLNKDWLTKIKDVQHDWKRRKLKNEMKGKNYSDGDPTAEPTLFFIFSVSTCNSFHSFCLYK